MGNLKEHTALFWPFLTTKQAHQVPLHIGALSREKVFSDLENLEPQMYQQHVVDTESVTSDTFNKFNSFYRNVQRETRHGVFGLSLSNKMA